MKINKISGIYPSLKTPSSSLELNNTNNEVRDVLNKKGVELVEIRGELHRLGPKEYFDKIVSVVLEDFSDPGYNFGAIDSLVYMLHLHKGTRHILPIANEDNMTLLKSGLLPGNYDQYDIMDFEVNSTREEKVAFIKSLSFG